MLVEFDEIVYVVEGLLQYELDGKQPVTLKAGDVLFILYGTIHAVKNVGGGKAASSPHPSSKKESRSSRWPIEHLGRAFCEPTLA